MFNLEIEQVDTVPLHILEEYHTELALPNGTMLKAYSDDDNFGFGTFIITSMDQTVTHVPPTIFNNDTIVNCEINLVLLDNQNIMIIYNSSYEKALGTIVILSPTGEIVLGPTHFAGNTGCIFISAYKLKNGNVAISYMKPLDNCYGTLAIVSQDGNFERTELEISGKRILDSFIVAEHNNEIAVVEYTMDSELVLSIYNLDTSRVTTFKILENVACAYANPVGNKGNFIVFFSMASGELNTLRAECRDDRYSLHYDDFFTNLLVHEKIRYFFKADRGDSILSYQNMNGETKTIKIKFYE